MSPSRRRARRSITAPTSTRSASSSTRWRAARCRSTPTTSWGSSRSTCTRRRSPSARSCPRSTCRRGSTPSCSSASRRSPRGATRRWTSWSPTSRSSSRACSPTRCSEMMARSGGFNVPADYFRSTAMPAPVPGDARGRRRSAGRSTPTIAAVGTGVAIVGVVLAAEQQQPGADAGGDGHRRVRRRPRRWPRRRRSPTVTATASAPAAPVRHEVLVSVTPGDATITRDGTDLGPAPSRSTWPTARRATLVVTRKGYKTKTVKVDGSTARGRSSRSTRSEASAPRAAPQPAPASRRDRRRRGSFRQEAVAVPRGRPTPQRSARRWRSSTFENSDPFQRYRTLPIPPHGRSSGSISPAPGVSCAQG